MKNAIKIAVGAGLILFLAYHWLKFVEFKQISIGVACPVLITIILVGSVLTLTRLK